MISSKGYADDALAAWSALGLDADVPFARAISSGEPVWALTREEMDVFTGAPALDDAGWVSVPLRTPAGIHGALHISLREPRELGEAERRWLQTVVSQCALALERSQLYDEEHRLRQQSERLQRTTAGLSNALTQSDVAEVVIAAALEGTDADSAVLYEVVEERQVLRRLAASGMADGDGKEPPAEVPLEEEAALARVVRRGGWWFEPPDTPGSASSAVERTRLAAPLVSGRQSVGVLELAWAEPVTLDDDDHRFLRTLASQGAQALDRARHFESERSIAETLQRSVLPVALPRVAGVQIAARYLPGTRGVDIGGDWFDAVELRDGRLGLIVGDVVGKGVHAAANMGQLRNALRAIAVERLKPPSALTRLDRLASDGHEATFATVVYAVVRPEGGCPASLVGRAPAAGRRVSGRPGRAPRGRPRASARNRASVRSTGRASSTCPPEASSSSTRTGSSSGAEARSTTGSTLSSLRCETVRATPSSSWSTSSSSSSRTRIERTTSRSWPHVFSPSRRDRSTSRSRAESARSISCAMRFEPGSRAPSSSRGDAEELLLAVWEVCANAIEHAEDPIDDAVRIRAFVDESRGARRRRRHRPLRPRRRPPESRASAFSSPSSSPPRSRSR